MDINIHAYVYEHCTFTQNKALRRVSCHILGGAKCSVLCAVNFANDNLC